ncbi:DUF4222 domain-containing protein [Scandinavium goeteborgense]|uniref:DUF4222 domain-containing protein n=1 Tax=Scandinavium goeteborgense TaxID=1851514 RepID=UPI00286EF278|nr:DUF4222 domain-containing protein [Scandinavium goeteborgense]
MCNVQELVIRMKHAMQQRLPAEPVDDSAIPIPGAKYRNDRGHMVTVLRASQLRVRFLREGYSDECEIGRREFVMKFRKV